MFDPDEFLGRMGVSEDSSKKKDTEEKKDTTSGFDPDEFLDRVGEEEDTSPRVPYEMPKYKRKKLGVGTTAILSGAQGLTAGFADEMIGGVAGTADFLKNAAQGKGKLSLAELKKMYAKRRDDARRVTKQAGKDNWKTAVLAEGLGSVVGFGKAAGAAKASKLGRKALQVGAKKLGARGAATAAGAAALTAEGAIHGVGHSEDKKVLDAASGVAFNFGGAGVGKLLGATLRGAGRAILPKDLAKAADKHTKNALKKTDANEASLIAKERNFGSTQEAAEQKVKDLYQYVRDEGIVAAGDTFEEITKKTRIAIDAGTRNIDNAIKAFDDSFSIPEGTLANVFEGVVDSSFRLSNGAIKKTRGAEVSFLRKLQEDLVEDYGQSAGAKSLLLARREVGNLLKAARASGNPDVGQVGVLHRVYEKTQEALIDNLSKASPELAKQFLKGNRASNLALEALGGDYVGKSIYNTISDATQRALTIGYGSKFIVGAAGAPIVGSAAAAGELASAAKDRWGATYLSAAYDGLNKLMTRGKLGAALGSKQAEAIRRAAIEGPKALTKQHLLLLTNSASYRSAVAGKEEE